MTDSTRAHAEQLAAERYNESWRHGIPADRAAKNAYISGFLAGRTVNAEQWANAVGEAKAYLDDGSAWEPDDLAESAAGIAWNILSTAGLIIEEEEKSDGVSGK